MTESLHLHTRLEPRGPAAAVVLSAEQLAALGGGRTPAVRITVGGRTIAGRVATMRGEHLVGLSKQARADLGVTIGELIDVEIALDTTPRTVDVPPDLAAALDADPAARAAFDALAHTHRKEHARSVTDAKRADTRARRVAAVLDALR